jgi:hypothetical protein
MDSGDRDDVPRRRGLRAHVGSGLRVRRPGDAIDEPRDDGAVAGSARRSEKPTWVMAATGTGTEMEAGTDAASGMRTEKPTWVTVATGTETETGTATAAGAASAAADTAGAGTGAPPPSVVDSDHDRDPPVGRPASVAIAARIGLRSNGRRGLRAYSRPSLLRAHLGRESGPVAIAAGDATARDRGGIELAPVSDAASPPGDAINPRDDRRG